MRSSWAVLLLLGAGVVAHARTCGTEPAQLQVLGSGGPDASDSRAASAILIWVKAKPRLLVDVGPGAAVRLLQANADTGDLDAVLLTHLRLARTADLPALLQLSTPAARTRSLPIYGPPGNRFMPSTVSFVRALFDPARGAWRELGELLSPLSRTSYKLEPHDLRPHHPGLVVTQDKRDEALPVFANDFVRVTALPLAYGPAPSLAWGVEAEGKHILISAVIGGNGVGLERFAHDVDMLVVPHPDARDTAATGASGVPAVAIAHLAHAAAVKQLVLAPRAQTTLGHEAESAEVIRRQYIGPIVFANDFDCLTP